MEPGNELDQDARDELRHTLVDEDYSAARHQYVSTICAVLINIEDWLAIDSWLGRGKLQHAEPNETPDQASFPAFRAVSTVVCMSAELAEAATLMADKRRYYAVGAVIRQLIECEYLLVLFNEDLSHAQRWRESTPDEIRKSFSPKEMRKLVGKFSNEEYWRHCDTGGHPAPKGTRLLEKMDPARQSWPFVAAELLIDLGLHLRRIWKAIDELLTKHHARYERVRAEQRTRAEEAWVAWQEVDPVVAALIEHAASGG